MAEAITIYANPGTLSGEVATIVSAKTIEASAGTFADPSRFLQTQAGVAAGDDQRNDFLVRGGNPSENVFVIDGIPVATINHLALSNTSGGFVSMLDNDAMESLTFHSGVHDARFDDRLSSVVEISTVPGAESDRKDTMHRSVEAGIAGVGMLMSKPLGRPGQADGSFLVSARRSVLNLITSDIGMNGVPIYSNGLVRADRTLSPRDKVWALSLAGVDSISIHPSAGDVVETNPFDISYHGWRNTTGAAWQHTLSGSAFSTATLSNSEQSQSIQQYDQLLNEQQVYGEQTHDGNTRLALAVTSQPAQRVVLEGGFEQTATRIHYNISQPIALPNPYSPLESPDDATGMQAHFTTGATGGWAQTTLLLAHGVRFTAGVRAGYWSFGGNRALSPRAVLSAPIRGRIVSAGFAEYAQMPAFLYLLAFPQNHVMSPIRVRHLTADAQLVQASRARISISAYQKLYSGYPVAASFPQLSMANIADTFGQPFLMFPMVSKGRGRTAGVELTLQSRLGSRVNLASNVSYARAWYSGLDGVLRRADIDIPLTVNVTANIRLRRSIGLALRYTGSSGRPYTPDDMTLSVAQNRDVYDLTRLNASRANPYGRLDFRVQGQRAVHGGILIWNAGLLNALNQKNFYSYQWQPRLAAFGAGGPVEQTQISLFPEGSVKLSF